MHLGEILEQTRVNRNMSVKDTIGNLVSRSNYYLFKKGQTDLRMDIILLLIERLHLDERESILISSEFTQNRVFYDHCSRMVDYYHSRDLASLKAEKSELEALDDNLPIVPVLIHVVNCYISSLEIQDILPEDREALKRYFLENDSWFIFELQLFARIGLLIAKQEYIDVIYHNIEKLLDSNSLITQSLANHCFHVLIMLCFEYRDGKKLSKILDRVLKVPFNDKLFYELQFNRFYHYLYQLIFENKSEMHLELHQYFTFINDIKATRTGMIAWRLYVGYLKYYEKPQVLNLDDYPNIFSKEEV